MVEMIKDVYRLYERKENGWNSWCPISIEARRFLWHYDKETFNYFYLLVPSREYIIKMDEILGKDNEYIKMVR
jgi:hypothetical protein